MNNPTTLERVQVAPAAVLSAVSQATAHSILEALSDGVSNKIMMSAVQRAMTVEEISSLHGIPLSTCYRRIQQLVDSGLVLMERIVITSSGKRFAIYRSSVKSFRVTVDARGTNVEAELNSEVAERIRERRISITYAVQGTEAA